MNGKQREAGGDEQRVAGGARMTVRKAVQVSVPGRLNAAFIIVLHIY